MSHNYNHRITIRDLRKEDMYNGIYAQSYGNIGYIFRLTHLPDNRLEYIPVFSINSKGDIIKKYSGGTRYVGNYSCWVETTHTVILNRDKKINTILDE